MTAPIRVLIADDHPLIRDGTRQILERAGDIEVVGEAASGEEAVELACARQPDVVLLDIAMPGIGGIEATRRIKAACPRTGVLVLTVHDEAQYVHAILEAGGAGYLLKDMPSSQVVEAVRAVWSGEPAMHPSVLRKILVDLATGDERRSGPAGDALSDRELEVLRAAARGASNKEIGDALGLSHRTVQVHLRSVFHKLDVSSRTEAVITGLRLGLLSLEELD